MAEPTSPLTLTVLGTGAPYPRPDQPCSGYLIRSASTALWIDAGSGTTSELQRHVQLDAVTALWISHLHPDHAGDLPAVANWLLNTAPERPLPIWAPPGWLLRLTTFLGSDLSSVVEPHELTDGLTADVGDLHVQAHQVAHSVTTYGMRITHHGRTCAYSADTGPCPAVTALATDADLFICEAGASTPTQPAYHCTPEQAGATARRANATRLILTHLAPGLDANDARHRAETTYREAVYVAAPGDHLAV